MRKIPFIISLLTLISLPAQATERRPELATVSLTNAAQSNSEAELTVDLLSAREIMRRVHDREDGDNSTMDTEMVLIDRQGKQRLRRIRSYRRDWNERDSQTIMFFQSPADVKNSAFLTFDFDDSAKDDDQWLYLPALKKTKRIAAADKSSSFMGSDFTYADMSKSNIENYEYRIIKETEINDHPVWQIESIPNNEEEIARTGYNKSIVFVRKDNFVVTRAINWVNKSQRLKFMEVLKLEKIDGIWTTLEMVMTTRKGKQLQHRSLIRFSNVKYNRPLDEGLFSQRRLSKGL